MCLIYIGSLHCFPDFELTCIGFFKSHDELEQSSLTGAVRTDSVTLTVSDGTNQAAATYTFKVDGNDSPAFDRSIDVCIGRLRKKLQDDPRNPGIIRTVRNGGYIFSAKVARH